MLERFSVPDTRSRIREDVARRIDASGVATKLTPSQTTKAGKLRQAIRSMTALRLLSVTVRKAAKTKDAHTFAVYDPH